jgi:hypothetical protein
VSVATQPTFPLALAGYVLLTGAFAHRLLRGRVHPPLAGALALVVTLHVLLIWTEVYELEPARAVRNGWAGAVVFHGAYLAILAHGVAGARARWAGWLVYPAWLLVSAGGIGATFKFDVVSGYRAPMLGVALLGLLAVAIRVRRGLRPRVP